MPQNHVIYGGKSATNTHTDCTQTHTHTHTRIAHKHTHGLHTNTHTDCTKHTHGLHINTHLLLPIVVFAIKTGMKTHTHTWGENRFFFGAGLPQQFRFLPFWRTPGAPDTVKYSTFGTPGALGAFQLLKYACFAHWGVSAIKKWPVLPPGAFQPLKMACFAPWGVSAIRNGLCCFLGRFSH